MKIVFCAELYFADYLKLVSFYWASLRVILTSHLCGRIFCSCKTSCFHHPHLFSLLPLTFLLFELKDQRSAVGEYNEGGMDKAGFAGERVFEK